MPSAAILAGGQARRFGGRDKGALLVGGRSILARQLDAVTRAADDVMLVTSNSTAPFAAELRANTVRVVLDRVEGKGPVAGLEAALVAARHDVLVIIAGDMPWVTAPLLDYLLSLATEPRTAQAVVPKTERGYHPLCAVYTRGCLPVVERQLADGRLRMRDVLERVSVRVVTRAELDRLGGSDRLLANVNTPADLDRLGALTLQECHEP